MASKKTPSKSGQTKSATTAAAQNIFNSPDQPAGDLVTTENLKKIVEDAVTTSVTNVVTGLVTSTKITPSAAAFKENEKLDVKELTSKIKGDVKAKEKAAKAAAKAAAKVAAKDKKSVAIKKDTKKTPEAPKELAPKPEAKRPTIKLKPKPENPTPPVEVPATNMAAEKPKLKSTQIPKTPVAAQPKKKTKAKSEAAPVAETPVSTPTGISINELAQKTDPDKPRVRFRLKAEPLKKYLSPVEEEKPMTAAAVLGKTVASKAAAEIIANKVEPTPETPTEKPQKPRIKISPDAPYWNRVPDKAEQVPNPERVDIKRLEKKIDAIQNASKVEKTEKPKKPLTAEERKSSRDDVIGVLKALKFKPSEFKELLDKVDHIDDTQEKIRLILKSLGNKGDTKSVIIPKAEIPANIAEAKENIKEPIVETPKKKVKIKRPPTNDGYVPKRSQNFFDPNDPNHRAKGPQLDLFTPKGPPKQLDLFTPQQAPAGNTAAPQTVAPVAPAPPSVPPPKVEVKDPDQEKADQLKKEKEEKKKEEEELKRQKKLDKKLDDIYKKISSKGLFDLISSGISNLLRMAFKPALNLLLKFAPILETIMAGIGSALGTLAVIAVGSAFVYKGVSWVLDKFGYTGETLGAAADYASHGSTNYSDKRDADKLKSTANMNLANTGYTEIGPGKFQDSKGETVTYDQLPENVKSKLGNYDNKASDVKKEAVKTDLQTAKADMTTAPTPKSDLASEAISAAPDVPDNDDSNAPATPIVIQQDNRKMSAPAPVNDGGAIIKVRNDEPSASGIVASLFEHPMSYGAVFRM